MAFNFPFKIEIKGIDKITEPLARVQQKISNVSKSFKRVGQQMTTYLTAPIVALGTFSVNSFLKQQDALDQVRARLRAVGETAGVTFDQLVTAAAKLQKDTLFGDETILRDVSTQLLTFTNITGKELMSAQEAILDVATVTKQDLKSTAIQLGKALNDPVANLGALGRTGIQFSEKQKKVIKALTKSGRLAEAQAIILKELKHQYGGAAKQAGETNPYIQLGNSLGDVAEKYGDLINEALKPLVVILRNLADKLASLSTPTKKMILIVAGIAAAIGPLLFVLGSLGFILSGLPTILGFVALGFNAVTGAVWGLGKALLTNPIGWWVLGLGLAALVVIKYWEPIKTFFTNLWDTIVDKFRWARDILAGIWNKIVDAVPFGKKTEFKVDQVSSFSNAQQGFSAPSVLTSSVAGNNSVITKESVLKVEFDNAPQGLRIDKSNLDDAVFTDVKVGKSFPMIMGASR